MHELGLTLPLWAVVPFVVMLGGIAILPLAAPHAWEKNHNKAIFALIVALPVGTWLGVSHIEALAHASVEYISFIALLGSLYVIAGGIHLSGDLEGRPSVNAAILLTGAVIANVVGTTGASMLLIRTLLRTNQQRRQRSHIPVFFVLIVSNCGGLLTPLGDPPLFLGYLRGVPFTWTLTLWPFWLVTIAYLVALFYVVDKRAYRRETKEDLARDEREQEPLKIHGGINALLLAGVVGSVFLPTPFREIAMVGLTLASLQLGPKKAREQNGFSFGPIIEVAILFAGIFVTMVPALALLDVHGAALGLTEPWEYFLATGSLSSVLDNAPTYLTLLSAAQAMGVPEGVVDQVVGIPGTFLAAISCGAVLMGANTYIGNGPNFMVKAIAEEGGYPMPSFFGYAATALVILVPVYVGLTLYFAF